MEEVHSGPQVPAGVVPSALPAKPLAIGKLGARTPEERQHVRLAECQPVVHVGVVRVKSARDRLHSAAYSLPGIDAAQCCDDTLPLR
jgi:hypothetical protein